MGTLADILSSRVREAIFQLLFGRIQREVHLRELARHSSFNPGTVRQELQKLLRLDLVKTRRGGNRLYYRANTNHALYPDIRSLVMKTLDLVEILKNVLDREGVKAAFVFGPLASQEENEASDVNLMVLGDVDRKVLRSWLSGVPFRIGRKVIVHSMTMEEFRRRREEANQLVAMALESFKLFIIGTENDLAATADNGESFPRA